MATPRLYAHVSGIGTGLRGFRRGTTGVVKNWRVTLTWSDGERSVIDIEDQHFAFMAISIAKAKLACGRTCTEESAVQL